MNKSRISFKTAFALLLLACCLLPACALSPEPVEEIVEAPRLPQLTIMPVEGGRITSHFGQRKLRREKRARMHWGIDIAAVRGTPVQAPAAGEVIFIGTVRGYGKTVEIDHGQGLVTRYAHLDKYQVKKGDTVEAGQKIGCVGRTGKTTGPNLHFEIILDKERIDPLLLAMWDKPSWDKYLAAIPGFKINPEDEPKLARQ